MFRKSHAAVLAGIVLLAGLSLSAGEPKACCKALKGIVHLSDNDVRFHSKDGKIVFVDPVTGPEDSLAVRTGMTRPDLILITHSHGDHFQPEVLKAYMKINPGVVIAGPAAIVKAAAENGIPGVKEAMPDHFELAGVKVRTLPAYFSEGSSHPKEAGWVGYIIHLNGLKFYVTGDTEPFAEMAESEADVIFPLLYGCGGNLDLAVKMAALSKASVVVPVHTGGNVEVIQKFIKSLPEGVMSGYYAEGKLVCCKK